MDILDDLMKIVEQVKSTYSQLYYEDKSKQYICYVSTTMTSLFPNAIDYLREYQNVKINEISSQYFPKNTVCFFIEEPDKTYTRIKKEVITND